MNKGRRFINFSYEELEILQDGIDSFEHPELYEELQEEFRERKRMLKETKEYCIM